MLVPSAQAGGIFALYRKNRIVMPIFTKWRKSANLFFADWRTSLIYKKPPACIKLKQGKTGAARKAAKAK